MPSSNKICRLDAICGDQTILKIENKMKEYGNFDKKLINEIKNYYDSIHGTVKFEDDTGKVLDRNGFDLLIFKQLFLWKISIGKSLVEQAK